jgi:hypothetical protein
MLVLATPQLVSYCHSKGYRQPNYVHLRQLQLVAIASTALFIMVIYEDDLDLFLVEK